MKAMILAGGFGTRFSEETEVRPKPMIEIGGRPILWHIMNSYSSHGINEFIICLGYKSEFIKKFFLDYSVTLSDFTINTQSGDLNIHARRAENWTVSLIDTGLNAMTGGRIKRAVEQLGLDSTFCLTYGDGLGNVDIKSSIDFHRSHGKLCTVTSVTPPGRFGVLEIDKDYSVTGFREKIASDQYRINGGFFVVEPSVSKLIKDEATVWEKEPLEALAQSGNLKSWSHEGFWHPMDTLRDKKHLQSLWETGTPPWA